MGIGGVRMEDRFKFRVFLKYNQIMCDIDSYCFLQGLNKCVFHFTNSGQKTLKNDDFILMQCTGLKDKNGKLIYEGDILGGTYGNLYVHYCDSCKQFQLKANDYGCIACEGDVHWYELVESEDENELEVIGNIYENPELLED